MPKKKQTHVGASSFVRIGLTIEEGADLPSTSDLLFLLSLSPPPPPPCVCVTHAFCEAGGVAASGGGSGGEPDSPRDVDAGSDGHVAVPMDFSPLPAAPPLSAMESEDAAAAACCLEVVAATRGGDASDEWTGDLVRVRGDGVSSDLGSLPTGLGPQQWEWADRAAYEVSYRPANDGGGVPAPGNISIQCQSQTGWSPCSKRQFEH